MRSVLFKNIQCIQNNLLRTLNGSKIKDKVSISSMLDTYNMLSVNQLNASIKLLMVWKSLNIDNYPLKIDRQKSSATCRTTRADSAGKPIEIGKSLLVQKTSVSDAIRVWNRSPTSVTGSVSLCQAKNEIRKFVKLLQI